MFIVTQSRFNPQQIGSAAVGLELILASIMESGGNGNRDEFLLLNTAFASDGEKDAFGRSMGIIVASTKGLF